MGAGTGNRNNMDAARRQQAMEGQAMRRRALEQQEQSAAGQEQLTPFETSAPQMGLGLGATPQPSMDVAQKCVQVLILVPVAPVGFQIKVVPSMSN
jgi:hypothetical protein